MTRFLIALAFFSAPLFTFAHVIDGGDGVVQGDKSTSTVIYMTDDGFEPQNIVVPESTTVTFKNVSTHDYWPASNVHPTHSGYPGSGIEKCNTDAASTIFDACRGLKPGESFSFHFDDVGTWRFHNHLDATQNGTITVTGVIRVSLLDKVMKAVNVPLTAIDTYYERLGFWMCSSCTQKVLSDVDIEQVRYNEDEARWLVRIFGSAKIMDALVAGAPRLEFDSGERERCHAAAHIIGRASYEVYGAEVFSFNLDSRCQFGFLHGSIESFVAQFHGEDIISEFNKACAAQTDAVARGQCQHSLGHGLMVYYDYDLPQALTSCDEVPDVGARGRCYEGAYMENAFSSYETPISAQDHSSPWVDKNRPDFPCDSALMKEAGQEKLSMCYYVQPLIWSPPFDGGPYDFAAGMEGCGRAPQSVKDKCYQGVGIGLGGVIPGDADDVAMCKTAPAEYILSCIGGVATVRRAHWGLDFTTERSKLCAVYDPQHVKECEQSIDKIDAWTLAP